MATLKMRVMTQFPALFNAGIGIAVERVGRAYTAMLDYLSVDSVDSVADLSTRFLLLASDNGDGTTLYERISLEDLPTSAAGSVQIITAGGTQDILPATGLVIVNQSVGAAITLNLPASEGKSGPVKIVDWKGDAGTNNITIMPDGSETFNGAAASWVIGSNNASAVFHPYANQGYAV